MDSTRSMFGWSHHLTMEIGDLHDVALETGFEERSAWLLILGAIATALSPLLLAGLRGGIPTIQAAIRWTGLVVGTAWLWIVLFTNGPALAAVAVSAFPGPHVVWAAAAIIFPMAVAICLGSFILGSKYKEVLPPARAALHQKQTLWGGWSAAGLFVLLVALFSGGDMMLPLASSGLAVFLISILLRYRTARGSVSQLGEGPLLDRIRELASCAGTSVRAVKLIRSDFDTPAAFADHKGGILLSRGLLNELSRSEVDAIVAHELSHIRRKHGAQMRGWLMVPPVAIVVSFLAPGFLVWAALLLPMCFLTFMALRRNQELTADADAARWTGGPEALIRGLTRATRGTGVPLDWSRWAGLVLAHPPTSERFRALGAKAGVSEDRISEIVASADTPPKARYELPDLADSSGGAYGPQRRAQLKLMLGLLALAYPVVYSIVIPMVVRVERLGWPALAATELGCGILLVYLIYEILVARARSSVRNRMRARVSKDGGDSLGFFTGFSPSSQPTLYDGMYDFEWGFVSFEGDRLIFRSEGGIFSAKRNEVARIWLHPGPASWTAKPMLCFELVPLSGDTPRGFSVRPFDDAFGLKAGVSAQTLKEAASNWHGGNASGSHSATGVPLYQYPSPAGQLEPPYPLTLLMKQIVRSSSYVFGGLGTLQLYIWKDWRLDTLWTGLLLMSGLVVFLAWPALRRSRCNGSTRN